MSHLSHPVPRESAFRAVCITAIVLLVTVPLRSRGMIEQSYAGENEGNMCRVPS